jgi:RimJ/RimL family protein N-acetyltransferase
MRYGIQRRTIYLEPAIGDDQTWMYRQFDRDEIWQMFGLPGPARLRVMRAHRTEQIVAGIIRRTSDRQRLGFVTMFAPTADFDFWELGYAITEPEHRDAFSALSATDAMAHYMFEHLGVEAMGWRTRADNRAADAVIRRLGYKAFGAWALDGHDYTFYRLDRPGWAARRAKLDKGELAAPGIGVFRKLDGPPFVPIPLPSSAPNPRSASPASPPSAKGGDQD